MSGMEREAQLLDAARSQAAVPFEIWPLLLKSAGAVAGSAISLVYLLPDTRREAFARLAVGFTAGLVFGGPVGIKIADALDIMGHLSFAEMNLMGAAAASLCAWGLLGMLVRFGRGHGAFGPR